MRFGFLLLSAAIFLSGCGSGSDFPTAPTRGRVICEGKPVPHVMIFFEPLETGKSAIVGRSGFAVAKEDGTFEISSYGTNDGAVIGKHRVRVGMPRAGDAPNFKCDCYVNAEVDLMEVEIKPGKNELDLVLKKKTGREPPVKIDD